MIPFAPHTAAETSSAYQWTEKPPKIAPCSGRTSTPSNTWSLGPIRVYLQSAVFAGLTNVTSRQTRLLHL